MRYYEIACGLRIPVSFEEQEVLDVIGNGESPGDDMDERTQEVARKMVSRGVLNRVVHGGKSHFKANSAKNIWRDRE